MSRGRLGSSPLSTLSFLILIVVSRFFVVSSSAFNVTMLSFDDGFSHLFGDKNLIRSSDGRKVQLVLDRYTGSGFISSEAYGFGLFSASIKLPSDYTAGVVVAFYTSNGDTFVKTHDELDFEFLGNIRGKKWKVQTNVYGNGSTSRGREERFFLPFDPTLEAHRYSIVWTNTTIIFYVDETPIREVIRSGATEGDFPSKPMWLYATIWDGSTWATSGGKHKVNYKFSPFTAEFTNLVLKGCPVDPIEQFPSTCSTDCSDVEEEVVAAEYAVMTARKRQAMRKFRLKHMVYSFCYDVKRYPVPLPDCDVVPEEKKRFKDTGHIKFRDSHRTRPSRKIRVRVPVAGDDGIEEFK